MAYVPFLRKRTHNTKLTILTYLFSFQQHLVYQQCISNSHCLVPEYFTAAKGNPTPYTHSPPPLRSKQLTTPIVFLSLQMCQFCVLPMNETTQYTNPYAQLFPLNTTPSRLMQGTECKLFYPLSWPSNMSLHVHSKSYSSIGLLTNIVFVFIFILKSVTMYTICKFLLENIVYSFQMFY